MDKIKLKLPDWAVGSLCCPVCNGKLIFHDRMQCRNENCRESFPIVNNIPILIDSKKSLFSIDDFLSGKDAYFKLPRRNFVDSLFKFTPQISANIKGNKNYRKLADFLLKNCKEPKVLILGGGIRGKGMEALFHSSIKPVETDISFGPQTMAVVDAHCIPFEDGSFDCVIAQAMLEHVADPCICVKEIHRVLRKDGVVYAETAFMQQVHGGKYDFTRFSYLGHRRLFAQFIEIESGAVCGTGMALAWAYECFLMSLSKSATISTFARFFARITAFWLKYLDYITINNPHTLNGASGYYFIGQKSEYPIKDKELIQKYT